VRHIIGAQRGMEYERLRPQAHKHLRLFVAMHYFMYTFHIMARMKFFISAWGRGSSFLVLGTIYSY
jgi:hypothetical protein